jgi:hypothetical protein
MPRSVLILIAAPILFFLLSGWAHAGQYQLRTTIPKNPYGGIVHAGVNSWAYGTYGSGYGGNAWDMEYAECVGTVTTVYDWVRDQIENPANPGTMIPDPWDEPPEFVISAEYCSASYYAMSHISSPLAFCDSGLGFDPVEDNA